MRPATIAEVHEIITEDGEVFDLTDGYARFVLRTPTGMGIPELEQLTLQRGQQGRLYRDYIVQPRELIISVRYTSCSRDTYWSGRLALLNALRPNRGGELSYKITLGDGTSYFIKGVIAANPFSNQPDGWDEWGYTEDLTIICNDPIWYSSDIVTVDINQESVDNLIFPITFPIEFEGNGSWGARAINYTGTWYSYPTFTVDGPFSSVTFTHKQKQVAVQLNYSASSADVVTFDIGNRLIYNSNGADLFSYLTSNTNLVDFRLEPDPVVANGRNTIAVDLTGSSGGVSMSYYKRWIGI